MKKNNRSKPLVIIQCYEDRQQTLPLRKVDHITSDCSINNHVESKRELTDTPPPPPPMPTTNGVNGTHKNINDQKSAQHKTDTNIITNMNIRQNGTLLRTPTPDYNNIKTSPAVSLNVKSIKEERVELDSLESFKLNNPSNVQPKPPSNYFMRAPNGTATMKKHVRPVSVTIGEYASVGAGGRREPSKLEFLNGDKPDGVRAPEDVPITNRLQSELVMTLSRSNLRKKTEALDQAVVTFSVRKDANTQEDSDSSLDKNFHARYGNNLLLLPPSISIPKISKLKH